MESFEPMGKVIQQVTFKDGTLLYITGWDDDNMILCYRKSDNAKLTSEVVKIDGEKVLLSDCWFNIAFLEKFIEENKQNEL